MGLTTWKGAGRGKVLGKQDVEIAKSYMNKEEIETLDLMINQYIDFARLLSDRGFSPQDYRLALHQREMWGIGKFADHYYFSAASDPDHPLRSV